MKKIVLGVCLSIILCLNSASVMAHQLETLQPLCCCETNCECEHEKNHTPILRNAACGDTVPGAISNATFQQLISQIHHSLNANNIQRDQWIAPTMIIKEVHIDILPPPPKNSPPII